MVAVPPAAVMLLLPAGVVLFLILAIPWPAVFLMRCRLKLMATVGPVLARPPWRMAPGAPGQRELMGQQTFHQIRDQHLGR